MGKREKKPNHRQRQSRGRDFSTDGEGFNEDRYNSFSSPSQPDDEEEDESPEVAEEEEEEEDNDEKEEVEANASNDLPSKFHLYQQSVQSPKGDISYLQKFFLIYVGGRQPLHLQEDFCGTALLSAEWMRTDARRTAVGLDLDLEALEWCIENNLNKVGGADLSTRISLFHGNVLNPSQAKLLKFSTEEMLQNVKLDEGNDKGVDSGNGSSEGEGTNALPKRDIVCAFNFSCCCLHNRADLVSYFKNALNTLSKRGGIFVMDLYGGTSSEGKLKLQRKFPDFTYMWEQAEFDIIGRKTRISLHYHLLKQNKKIRHAFSYSWRLWSLPEIKDCLEEAGFRAVHFWLREMPDTSASKSTQGFGAGRDLKYEELKSFQQCDAWNAYVVAVAN